MRQNPLLPTLNPYQDIDKTPFLTHCKGGGNCSLKKVLKQSRPSTTLCPSEGSYFKIKRSGWSLKSLSSIMDHVLVNPRVLLNSIERLTNGLSMASTVVTLNRAFCLNAPELSLSLYTYLYIYIYPLLWSELLSCLRSLSLPQLQLKLCCCKDNASLLLARGLREHSTLLLCSGPPRAAVTLGQVLSRSHNIQTKARVDLICKPNFMLVNHYH